MVDTRVVVVEGIMGTGKSTTAWFLARQLRRTGMNVRCVFEWSRPHPTDVIRERYRILSAPHEVWHRSGIAELMAASNARWKSFARSLQRTDQIVVLDGQLFNGDTTALMLLGANSQQLAEHVRTIEGALDPLRPTLINLRHPDMAASLRRIARRRGPHWVRQQLELKMRSPLAERLGLHGIDGWIELYERYVALTDQLFERLRMRRLRVDTSHGDWESRRLAILRFLDVEPVADPWFAIARVLRETAARLRRGTSAGLPTGARSAGDADASRSARPADRVSRGA